MIKNFRQFNEELSPELLKRAARSAYNRNQEARGDSFYHAGEAAERSMKNTKKRANYDEFMSLTGGKLFGVDCIVENTRVNPGGDTWIELRGEFRTNFSGRLVTRIFITDDLIKEDKVLIVGEGGTENAIDVKDLVLERKDARDYSNFLNWWKGEQKPFSVDDYCIKGIHIN